MADRRTHRSRQPQLPDRMAHAGGSTDRAQDKRLLAAASSGDEMAYRELVEPYRGALHAHCYRMVGAIDDAEDAVQETLLRAWRGLHGFEGRSSLRTWLYSIATNTCLTLIAGRPERGIPLAPAAESDLLHPVAEASEELLWIEPYPDQRIAVTDGRAAPEARYELRESVELAFIAALQHLPATQRAVLIMRDVLGFSAREVAASLATSIPAVKSLLQRARDSIESRLPERSQQATLRSLGDDSIREIVERYMRTWERGDVDGLVAMLTDDASLTMPPSPLRYSGRDQIAAFCAAGPMAGALAWRHVGCRVSGQLAVGCYAWDRNVWSYTARAIDVLTLRGDRIAAITSFPDAGLFVRHGLPPRLDARRADRGPELVLRTLPSSRRNLR